MRYTHSGNYEARGASGDYKARGASGDEENRKAVEESGKPLPP